MIQVPEEYVDNYVTEMFKKKENVDAFVDRAIDLKLIEALKKSRYNSKLKRLH